MATVAAVNSMGKYAFNPRGNLWVNDDSKFGHKLLLKMGWSKGKGLGKKEDGIKDNIKVKVKSTNSGVGWKEKSHTHIQNMDYDSLLQSLSAVHSQQPVAQNKNNENDLPKSGSLVQRSQAFRNRLHYQKFIRGKDISKYSEKDMKSIFMLNKDSEKDEEKPVLKSSSSIRKESDSENKVETYNSQLSISDYFAMKMKGKQSDKISRILDPQPTFPDFIKIEDENSLANKTTSSDKKRKKALIVPINGDGINSFEEHTGIPLEAARPNKRRKKTVEKSFSNNYDSDTDITCAIQKMHSEEPAISKKRKKKHRLIESISADSIEILGKNADCEKSENNFEVDLTQSVGVEILEPALSDNIKFNNNSVTCDIQELHREKPGSSKKRKKNHINEDVCIPSKSIKLPAKSANYPKIKKKNSFKVDLNGVESIEIFESVPSGNTSLIREQKKAKRKLKHLKKLKSCLKSRSGKYSLKNVSFNEIVSFRIIDSDNECNSDSEVDATNETDCITLDATNEKDCITLDAINADCITLDVTNETDCITLDATNETECITLDAANEIDCITLDATNETQCNPLDANCASESDDKDVTTTDREIEVSEQIVDSSSSTAVEDVEAESEVGCSLSNLPSSKSSIYNEWVASQRQALKMKMYKRMMKNIKKHEVLRTTNLLSIRGYGNWGY